MQEDDGALGDVRDVGHGSGEVEPASLGIVVSVTPNVEPGMLEDGGVVAPARLWQVNCPKKWIFISIDIKGGATCSGGNAWK